MKLLGMTLGAGRYGRCRFGLDHGLYLLSLAILMVTVLLPVLMIAYSTFFAGGRLDWRMFTRVVFDAGNLKSVGNTIIIAFWVTVGGTFLGLFYAWLIGRSDIPLKGLMKSLFTIPYMFPPFFGAMAWSLLLAPRSGYINRLFMNITGGGTQLFNMHSISGIVFVEICYYFPFVFLQVVSALERMDPTLEESARIAGAGQWYVIRKITLPLVLPATAAGAMLILISSLSHFGVPAILGFSQNIFTLPTKIYQLIRRSAGSFQGIREGAALSILLILVVVGALFVQKTILKTGHYDIIKGKSMRPMLIKLRGARFPMLAVCLISLAVIVVLPLAVILLVGLLRAYGLPFRWENFTLRNYQYILFRSQMVIDAIRNSLFLSVTSGVITMFLGVMIAYVVVKVRPKGKIFLEILSLLPYSMPGIVLAIGVILVWSGAFYFNLYNTIWIILIAYIARYVSFAMKSASASLEQVHYSLEEAARSCGATHLESLRDITLPLIRPGMVAGFFLIFLPGMRELTTSVLLYGPFTRTLGVAIYSMNAEGNTVQSSALATIAIAIIMIGNLLLRWVTRERKGL